MYREDELIRIAKRENNQKRKYLLVNPLQGKHIPVKPHKALELFKTLAGTLKAVYAQEKLLLVGFAETATAIGAAAAVELSARYIQTTREQIPGAQFLQFTEDHSHATEQKLVKNDMDRVMHQIDRIVFIEDEVTTGKTILHVIDVLKKNYPKFTQFAVASIINAMDESALKTYAERGIPVHYLLKPSQKDYTRIAEQTSGNGQYVPADTRREMSGITQLKIGGRMDTRRLVRAEDYRIACENLCNEIFAQVEVSRFKSLLVIGTEEFMYPALYVASRAEEKGVEAFCHATTRSPIAVSGEEGYPLHMRYELRSLYDSQRVTFLYDIGSYDGVLILTDAQDETEGLYSLINAVRLKNQGFVAWIRWCEK